jgi:prepilin-type N-terminal cleavage/methylation domain-containing protein
MKSIRLSIKGFSLIEMLLVLVIISAIIVMGMNYAQQKAQSMRIDRTVMQIQSILNAAQAYFVDHGQWTTGGNVLMDDHYLPNNAFNSPWGSVTTTPSYQMPNMAGFMNANPTAPNMEYLWITFTGPKAYALATVIAGALPVAYTTNTTTANNPMPPQDTACSPGEDCTIVASISMPLINLNNATAVNFAGLYHHGACVPVPSCPPGMTPEIVVTPVSLSGVYSNCSASGTCPTSGSLPAYPITSFTAYATGPGQSGNSYPVAQGPANCTNGYALNNQCYMLASSPGYTGENVRDGSYWRVCADVETELGTVSWGNQIPSQTYPGDPSYSGQYVTLLALTRCSITGIPPGTGENSGSSFNVWSF